LACSSHSSGPAPLARRAGPGWGTSLSFGMAWCGVCIVSVVKSKDWGQYRGCGELWLWRRRQQQQQQQQQQGGRSCDGGGVLGVTQRSAMQAGGRQVSRFCFCFCFFSKSRHSSGQACWREFTPRAVQYSGNSGKAQPPPR
jgi:hypothetical protein